MDRISKFDNPEDYDNLSIELRVKIYEKATDWFYQNEKEIKSLMKNCNSSYPPADRDLYIPEVWNTENWRWFIERLCS